MQLDKQLKDSCGDKNQCPRDWKVFSHLDSSENPLYTVEVFIHYTVEVFILPQYKHFDITVENSRENTQKFASQGEYYQHDVAPS